ncbi:hypothetical protein [Streptomyces klenkii]|uniref:hypothetical protein n=1 Tax=Streptomyces klenkii TaxID=1420899 RepID=UPI0034377075
MHDLTRSRQSPARAESLLDDADTIHQHPTCTEERKQLMPQAQQAPAGVKEQYAIKVAADLERNAKEQERISIEAAALADQLRTLQHDHAVLVSVQQALAGENSSAPAPAEASKTAVPKPRSSAAAPKPARQRKSVNARAKGKSAKDTDTTTAKATEPTLVSLLRDQLSRQSEPRSAAEITAAISQAYPDRNVKPTVVRTTMEGLVAKGHAQRTKQGASVFYAAPDNETPSLAGDTKTATA